MKLQKYWKTSLGILALFPLICAFTQNSLACGSSKPDYVYDPNHGRNMAQAPQYHDGYGADQARYESEQKGRDSDQIVAEWKQNKNKGNDEFKKFLKGLTKDELKLLRQIQKRELKDALSFKEIHHWLKRWNMPENVEVVVGIDYTRSNTLGDTDGGLHRLGKSPDDFNHYQHALDAFQQTIFGEDVNGRVTMLAFGDKSSMTIQPTPGYVHMVNGIDPSSGARIYDVPRREVLNTYNQYTAQTIQLDSFHGPTNYGPVIEYAANSAAKSRSFHLGFILTDGGVTSGAAGAMKRIQRSMDGQEETIQIESLEDTKREIIQASQAAPLALIAVGVGDGDDGSGSFGILDNLDSHVKGRKFDNVQVAKVREFLDPVTRQLEIVRFIQTAVEEIPMQIVYMIRHDLL